MGRINVTVGVENQLAAIAMALPLRDCFYINAKLDCANNKHAAK